MKKHLLISALVLLGTAAGVAQTLSVDKAQPRSQRTRHIDAQTLKTSAAREQVKQLMQTARPMEATKAAAAVSAPLAKAPRKSFADGVLMLRPEGTFYNAVQLTDGSSHSAVLIPPFTDLKFRNYCRDYETAQWDVNGTALEGDENNDLDYFITKGTSPYSLYYAPSITSNGKQFAGVDFVQPVDSGLYAFNYINTILSGYWYSTSGSPFMTEDIPWQGNNYKSGGIRQYFVEKPARPLVLYDIFFPFYSSSAHPVGNGQHLTAIVRKLGVDDEGYLELRDTLAIMEVASNEIETLGKINNTFTQYGATFALFEEDEFGTPTATPIVIDDMFSVEIIGFDTRNTDVQAFWCSPGPNGEDHAGDEAEFWTGSTRPTLIVTDDLEGNEALTLRYYTLNEEDPSSSYCYNAIFFLEGEMDAVYVDGDNVQTAPDAGGESSDSNGEENAVYLFTTFPIFDNATGEYEYAYNYDVEGVPEWAKVQIYPRYYDNESYTNLRGLNLVWFEVEKLPDGVEGRSAAVNVVSARGAEVNVPIYLLQGNAEIPDGVQAIRFDAAGKLVKTYNLSGQAVSDNAKGVVIRNGQKFFNK